MYMYTDACLLVRGVALVIIPGVNSQMCLPGTTKLVHAKSKGQAVYYRLPHTGEEDIPLVVLGYNYQAETFLTSFNLNITF